jgi:pimeloyl-ACP methyl ester carboxylesterase
MPELELSQGTVHYRDQGAGPTVVLIHGLLVNGGVWDALLPHLRDVRCIVPDLPLGSHRIPMKSAADLSPLGLASLIAELIERLELSDVTLVGNDTGGALCQLVCAHHPERIGRLVLTNCDAFEHFPPQALKAVVNGLARVPGAIAGLDLFARSKFVRTRSMALMPLTMEPLPDERLKDWVAPLHSSRVRRDLRRVLRGISPRYTIEAAERLQRFERPVLIAWGLRDKFFAFEDAERLADTFPDARIERIENARTFVQLDAPGRLGSLVSEFASGSAAAAMPDRVA